MVVRLTHGSALDCGSSGSGWGHFFVFLDKTYSSPRCINGYQQFSYWGSPLRWTK